MTIRVLVLAICLSPYGSWASGAVVSFRPPSSARIRAALLKLEERNSGYTQFDAYLKLLTNAFAEAAASHPGRVPEKLDHWACQIDAQARSLLVQGLRQIELTPRDILRREKWVQDFTSRLIEAMPAAARDQAHPQAATFAKKADLYLSYLPVPAFDCREAALEYLSSSCEVLAAILWKLRFDGIISQTERRELASFGLRIWAESWLVSGTSDESRLVEALSRWSVGRVFLRRLRHNMAILAHERGAQRRWLSFEEELLGQQSRLKRILLPQACLRKALKAWVYQILTENGGDFELYTSRTSCEKLFR